MRTHKHTTAAAPGEGTRPTTAAIPQSINPFNAEKEPVQHARFEAIMTAIQAGKTDAEVCAEFKTGAKSVAEIRAKLGEGKKEPGAPTPGPSPQSGEGGAETAPEETAPGEGTRPTTAEA